MTDLEITRLCAEAIGWKYLGAIGVPVPPEDKRDASGYWCINGNNDWWINPEGSHICGPCQGIPDPLHDDAQAMALVKKFRLQIGAAAKSFTVVDFATEKLATNADLNRAICECVAKMQGRNFESK